MDKRITESISDRRIREYIENKYKTQETLKKSLKKDSLTATFLLIMNVIGAALTLVVLLLLMFAPHYIPYLLPIGFPFWVAGTVTLIKAVWK
jgi:uncharacterized membrane protein YbhN (UPF0104 family)